MTHLKHLLISAFVLMIGITVESVDSKPKVVVTETVTSIFTGFFDAFWSSFGLIFVSEVGDETFIIAALMAMQHPRTLVFCGAFGALAIMTALSTALGIVVPQLISRQTVRRFACVLYTGFGFRLLWIGYKTGKEETVEDEIRDVEAQLSGSTVLRKRRVSSDEGVSLLRPLEGRKRVGMRQAVETALMGKKIVDLPSEKSKCAKLKVTMRVALSNVVNPVFLEAFVLTFLAEWGDRSQLATIALATHYNAIGVTVGGILGHGICTMGAVVGGKMLALKISPRPVAIFGGLTFLACAYYAYFHGDKLM